MLYILSNGKGGGGCILSFHFSFVSFLNIELAIIWKVMPYFKAQMKSTIDHIVQKEPDWNQDPVLNDAGRRLVTDFEYLNNE
jgi:hypothetical protein